MNPKNIKERAVSFYLNRELHEAVNEALCAKDLSLVRIRKLVEAGADPNSQNDRGQLLLSLALMLDTSRKKTDYVRFIEDLLDLGFGVDARDKYERTPLHVTGASMLSTQKALPVIDLLIKRGADVNAQDQFGQTPLHYAAFHNMNDNLDNVVIIQKLLKKGADPDLREKHGWPPLYLSVYNNNPHIINLLDSAPAGDTRAVIEKIIADMKADVNAENPYGKNIMHCIRFYPDSEHPAFVRRLLHAGLKLKPDAQDYQVKTQYESLLEVPPRNHYETPLHLAASLSENPETCKVLLDEGANINEKIKAVEKYDEGCTPLHYAARDNENPAVLQLLIQAEADVHAKDSHGNTPLHLAARSKNSNAMHVLLDACADVHAQDEGGWTPLHSAVFDHEVNIDVPKILLNAGAKLNAQDKFGQTPLHLAANFDNPSLIASLVNEGAKLEARDEDGCTPLLAAAKSENSSVESIEALLNAGADPNVKDAKGKTAWEWAKETHSFNDKDKDADVWRRLKGETSKGEASQSSQDMSP